MAITCEQVARAGLGEPVKREGAELVYRCPHGERHKDNDSHPSLKINPTKDVWLCAPCGGKGKAWALAAFLGGLDPNNKEGVKAWLAEKGLLPKREHKAKGKAERGPCVAIYTYTDAEGKPLARKLRFEPGENGKKKSFTWQRAENGEWVSGLSNPQDKLPLYRITQIVSKELVIVTEGEKDADRGVGIGLDTCTSGGVGSWRAQHSESLRNKVVFVLAHADEPGRVHAQRVAESLYGVAANVAVVEIPGCKDLADAIARGWTFEKLQNLFDSTPDWRPQTGAEILDSVMEFIRPFVSMTAHQARVVALWVAHTFAFDAADTTPYLSVNSPEKRSGKTRLLEVLRLLVFGAWFTGRITAAVLTRKVDSEHPTLLLDESDAAFRGKEEYGEALRGIFNTGYRRGGTASCCVGQGTNITYKDFSTFCPKCVGGIGRLPDTIADRSIPIRLKRARPGAVTKFREREVHREGSDIAARLAAWCAANLETLREARPAIPAQLSDRQSDCCEPLLAIADLAGGEWPTAGRLALVTLCGQAELDDDSIGVRLLRDTWVIFGERGVDELPSTELCQSLAKVETSEWGDMHGKPMTPMRLAALLKPFEIFPGQIQNGTARGYRLAQFRECFSLYLPPQGVKVSETHENSGDDEDFKVSKKKSVDTLGNPISPNKHAASRHLDTLKVREASEQESEKPTNPVRFQEDKDVLEL